MLLVFTLLLTGLAAVSSYRRIRTCIDLVPPMPSSSDRFSALNLTVQCGSNVTTLTWRSNGNDVLDGTKLIAIEYTCSNLSSGLNHTVQVEGPNSQYNSHSTIYNLPFDDVNFYCIFRACYENTQYSNEYLWNEDSASCSHEDVHKHSEDIYDMPQDAGEILSSSVGFMAATPTLVDIPTSTTQETSEINKSTRDITYTSSSAIQRVTVLETNTEIDNLLSSSKTTSSTTSAGFEATAISTGGTSELTYTSSSVIQRITASTESGAKASADGLSSNMVFVIVGLLVAVIGGVMLLILMTVCFSYRRWLRKTTSIQFKYQIEQKFQEEPVRSVSFYNIESNNSSGSNVTIVHSLSIKQSPTYEKTANDNVAKPTSDESSATNSCVALDVPMNEHEGSTSCSTPSKNFSATSAPVIDNDYKKTVSNSNRYTQEVGVISNDIKAEKSNIPLSKPPSHAKQDSVFDGYLGGEPIDSVKTTHHQQCASSHVRQDSVFDGYLGGEPTDRVRTTILDRQHQSRQSYPSSSAESAYVSGASSSSMSTNTDYLASDFTDSSSNHQLEGTILEKSSPMLCEEPYSSCTIPNNTINIMSGYLDNHPQSKAVPAAINESHHIARNQLALPTNADYIGLETEMIQDDNEVNRGDQVAIDVCEMMDYQYTGNSPYLSSSSEIPLPTADDYLVSFKKKPTTINSDVVAFKMTSTISHHKQALEDQLNNTSTDICELDNDPAPATSNYIDSSFPARFSSTSAATPTFHSSYITSTIELDLCEVDNDPTTSTLNYTKPLLVPANFNSNATPTHQLSYNSIQSIDQLSVSSTATERTVIASNVDDGYIS